MSEGLPAPYFTQHLYPSILCSITVVNFTFASTSVYIRVMGFKAANFQLFVE